MSLLQFVACHRVGGSSSMSNPQLPSSLTAISPSRFTIPPPPAPSLGENPPEHSLMTMCLAVGSVANALLPRTKGEGMGLLPIALSVGLGIGLPIGIFFRTVSGVDAYQCLVLNGGVRRPVGCGWPTGWPSGWPLASSCERRAVGSVPGNHAPQCLLCSSSTFNSPFVQPPQSAYFNPGILMAVTVRGNVPAGDFFALLAAEIVGYFAGGWVGRSFVALFRSMART